MKKPLMAGNWKMYKTPDETRAFFEQFMPLAGNAAHCDVLICPPFLNVASAVEASRGSRVVIGGQDLHWEKEGAFTGEVSGLMLKAVGCSAVLIGHSERRQYFHETDETVFRKTVAALDAGLQPVVCVGERLAERESGQTNAVLEGQFRDGLGGLAPDQFARVVIAYEPVWAIGTDRVATPEQAAEAHRFLRAQARARFGKQAGDDLRILYGGSVKPGNIRGLMAQPELNGVLVGGASLKAADFALIVNY